MKKFTLAATIMAIFLAANPVAAYENSAAGFTVKEKNPFLLVNSQRLFAFTDAQNFDEMQNSEKNGFHIVRYYQGELLDNVIGEKFTTAYFNEQYDKLAALDESDLSLKTVPLPLLDFKKYHNAAYAKNEDLANYFTQIENAGNLIAPNLSITRIRNQNAINLTHLYRQADHILSLRTTLLSANDKLYVLTSIGSIKENFVETAVDDSMENLEDGTLKQTDALDELTVGEFKELMRPQAVNEADVDAAMIKNFSLAHEKFVKSFKTIVPITATTPLIYTDKLAKKTIKLPDDWLYLQMRYSDADAKTNIVCSLPYDLLEKISFSKQFYKTFAALNGKDDEMLLSEALFGDNDKANGSFSQKRLQSKVVNMLQGLDTLFLTASIVSKKANVAEELTGSSELNQVISLIEKGMERLRDMGVGDNYLSFDNYEYSTNVAKDKATMEIWAESTLLQQYPLTNHFKLSVMGKKALLAWQMQSLEAIAHQDIEDAIAGYQF